MDKEKALKLWDTIFGKNKEWALDCFNTWMHREDYGDTEKKRIRPGNSKEFNYGWEIDHIRPKSDFGDNADPDLWNNYEIMYWSNNRTKGDNYPQFEIDGKKYKVVKCEICENGGLKGYGITDSEGNRIDWKGRNKTIFVNNK